MAAGFYHIGILLQKVQASKTLPVRVPFPLSRFAGQ
jgi:hypothetical protein